MESAFQCIPTAGVPPPKVDTDEVLPMFEFDKYWRFIVICKTLCFNDVLDVDKLHRSFARLLEMGEWRKLGGRIRQNDKGDFEIHIPRQFTDERPALTFSHTQFAMSIKDHPQASKIPHTSKGATTPAIWDAPEFFQTIDRPKGFPGGIDDFLYSDRPQCHLHVTSFHDATLVSYSWPHCAMDAMGMQAIYKAWAKVMAGQEDQVLPLAGFSDPMGDFGLVKPRQPWIFEPILMGFVSLVVYGVRLMLSSWLRPKDELRALFLPAAAVARLRADALAQVPPTDENGKATFLSEGDVLLAWLTRAAVRPMSRLQRDVVLLNAVDLRGRLPDRFPPTHSYVQNGMFIMLNPLKAAELANGTVGSVALRLRRLLLRQVEPEQLEAQAHINREMRRKYKAMPMVGPLHGKFVACSNWAKADYFDVIDFSPAVVRQGEHDACRVNPVGKAAFFYWHMLSDKPAGMSNVLNILGKDREGNYWVTALLKPKTWKVVEAEMAMLSAAVQEGKDGSKS